VAQAIADWPRHRQDSAQDRSKVTKAPKLGKDDGVIDWTRPSLEIHNLVRAMQPGRRPRPTGSERMVPCGSSSTGRA